MTTRQNQNQNTQQQQQQNIQNHDRIFIVQREANISISVYPQRRYLRFINFSKVEEIKFDKEPNFSK